MDITLTTPITDFPGVGATRAKKLEKLGLVTAGDLVRYFPREYEDRRTCSAIADAPTGVRVCVQAMVTERAQLNHVRRGLDLVKVTVADHTSRMYITYFNQPYLKDNLHVGEEYIFFGEVEVNGRVRRMTNPVTEPVSRSDITRCILPVYRLTAGISNRLMLTLVRRAVDGCAEQMPEALPDEILRQYSLAQNEFAYRTIHAPKDFEQLELARRRLIFEELFYLSTGLALLKHRRTGEQGLACACGDLTAFLNLLPFEPTKAQLQVMEQCRVDMGSGRPMNRLVQGDVGSGKTTVAAAAVWIAAHSGLQSALMAPTELLAQQHYRSLSGLLEPAGLRVALLTGSMTAAHKRKTLMEMQSGAVQLVVGTHALLSQGVEFAALGLVVVDEQHRFGVEQRAALSAKGGRPHVLVMSATPIPRTLALIVYGDLDVSVIDQLPPGRVPVDTFMIGEDKRQRMYGFIRTQAQQGHQSFIVCPAVEDAALEGAYLPDLKAVTTYAAHLREQVFPDLRVGLIHGKLKAKEKEQTMAAFAAGALDVLVSTTVVEVGVDVPNATLMVVEDAHRFGLSQLHQLRGRVGRGSHKSYCVLMTSTHSKGSLERLKVMTSTTDGFAIAQEDLRLRGPGDFFGDRQHGLPQLHIANLAEDMRSLKQAQQAASRMLETDPELSLPQHRAVRERIRTLFAGEADIFN